MKHDDHLVRFYTGFITYRIVLAFFNFLGLVVNNLKYWGSKEGTHVRNRKRKLDPENQLFMALVKLRLNLMTKDLAFRLGLSTAQVLDTSLHGFASFTIISGYLLLSKLLELFLVFLKKSFQTHLLL